MMQARGSAAYGSQRAAFEMAPSSCSSVTVATRRRTGDAAARTSCPPGTVPAHGEAARARSHADGVHTEKRAPEEHGFGSGWQS